MTVDVLAKSQATTILVYLCRNGEAQFSEIRDQLDLNPSIVDRRLTEFIEAGAVRKYKGLYRITDVGRQTTAVLTYLDEDICRELCREEMCLGPLSVAIDELEGQAESRIHGLLAATPATPRALADELDWEEDVLEERLEMATLWGFVREEDGVVVTTVSGERLRVALDAVADAPPDRVGRLRSPD